MKVRFNFNLSTWMRGIEIEADSFEEAEEKLYKMSLTEMLEVGYDDETSIDDVDGEILEKTIKVRAYDIEYDIEEDDFDDLDEYNKLINSLPDEMTLEITMEPNQLEDILIADEISYETDQMVKDFKFVIIEER
jgi:hypothetical protein